MWIVARHGTVLLIVMGALVALGMSGALGIQGYFFGKML